MLYIYYLKNKNAISVKHILTKLNLNKQIPDVKLYQILGTSKL